MRSKPGIETTIPVDVVFKRYNWYGWILDEHPEYNRYLNILGADLTGDEEEE